MTTKAMAALVAAGIGIGGAVALARQGQPPAAATMTLAMANGACGKTLVGNDSGDRIRQHRGGAIQWIVVNHCAGNATVAVGGWNPSSPFAGGNPDCEARPGGGKCTITQTVRGNAAPGTYSYAVSINGVATDPDVIIEQ